MFQETDTADALPWNRISSKDTKEATLKVIKRMVKVIGKRVAEVKEGTPALLASNRPQRPFFEHAPSLRKADLSQTLSKDEYREMLVSRQHKIQDLHHEVYRLRIPVVIVYEGWDAAGKGEYRRLTERMDPRGYEVIPISAPHDIESPSLPLALLDGVSQSGTCHHF